MRVLVVEDDKNLRNLIVKVLSSNAFAVDSTSSGDKARELALVYPYDLILLDVVLPDANGLRICKYFRENEIDSPVLMMSVRKNIRQRVSGLDSGADDYLPKPFEIDELMARIRSLLRRRSNWSKSILTAGPIMLDQNKRTVSVNLKRLSLSNREFMLLEYLMENEGKVISREQLIDHVWDQSYDSFSNVVDVFICYLRQKLFRARVRGTLIQTIRGTGYRFCVGDDVIVKSY